MPRPVLLISWVICLAVIALFLHSSWAFAAWVLALTAGATWYSQPRPSNAFEVLRFSPTQYLSLAVLLGASTLVRLYKLDELPLGPYVDELVVVVRSLQLSESTFDPFGHTPLMREGWVETPNLYLYFNLLLLEIFGVNNTGLKLISAIPGILACIGIYLICIQLFSDRIAMCTALLFATAHWTVRLSRYGWDVSFMVMAFSATIALLVAGMRRNSEQLIYFAGGVAGIALYSYAAARIAVFSMLAFLAIEWVVRRERLDARSVAAFLVGLITAGFPLLCYYLSNPHAFWVRAAELSVFAIDHPWRTIADNLWRHAAMFHVTGGYYARDNTPGLAMMDPITGFLLVAGLVWLLTRPGDTNSRLIACTFIINFVPGVFTHSQEGAPYVYRVAAVMVPAFLLVGMGLQALERRYEVSAGVRPTRSGAKGFSIVMLSLAIATNLVQYFWFEAANSAAMRTMAFEQNLLGREIAQDNTMTLVAGSKLSEKIEITSLPGEKYPDRNPPMRLPPAVSVVATIVLSGRYDASRPLQDNVDSPRDLRFLGDGSNISVAIADYKPGKIIFDAQDFAIVSQLRDASSDVKFRYLENIHGVPIFAVATFGKSRD